MSHPAGQLTWLSPSAASLVALARATSAAVFSEIRHDPGAVLLLARTPDGSHLQAALDHLNDGATGFVDWSQPDNAPIHRAAVACAHAAEFIARRTGRVDPHRAWTAGLLAPLGNLANCALAADIADISDSRLARRLNTQWNLPAWLAAITGHLALPLDFAVTLGAEADTFRIAQLAVLVVQKRGHGFDLAVGSELPALARDFQISTTDLDELFDSLESTRLSMRWEAPEEVALLPDLLRLAIDRQRLAQIASLQVQVDALHDAFAQQRDGETERLRQHKLAALGELAAGAGHEINNPLAVISGQAQYLLLQEIDPARRKSLQTIVGQTQRIHQTLTGLMQFARPPLPNLQAVEVGGILHEVTIALRSVAEDKQINLICTEPSPPVGAHADPAQLRTTLICLVRNALEAAPEQGWASLRVDLAEPDRLQFIIEDNGPGLSDTDRQHLFDPFYSGRKAGRGRGLGLSTAWRLAQQHQGDVCFVDVPGGPTRFVLTWPRATLPPTPPLQVFVEPPLPPAELGGMHAAAASDR